MGRPSRKGLSYFPLDTDFMSDRKIQRLIAKFGVKGIVTYLTLLCEIYRTNGYFCPYNQELCFDIGFLLKIEEAEIRDIIQECIRIRLFNGQLFRKHKVLTSAGIQVRYNEIYKRRVNRIDPVLKIESKTKIIATKTPVSVAETPVIVTEIPVLDAKTPTKGKGKGKGKENNKEKNNNQKKKNFYEEEFNQQNGDEARRAELIQMAIAATTGKRDA